MVRYHEGGPFVLVTDVYRAGIWSGEVLALFKLFLPIFITCTFCVLVRCALETFLLGDRLALTLHSPFGMGVSDIIFPSSFVFTEFPTDNQQDPRKFK